MDERKAAILSELRTKGRARIDFSYTAPELLPLRIQEVLDAPNEPHRIGGVVYVPEGGSECEITPITPDSDIGWCSACGSIAVVGSNYCRQCGAKAMKR